VRLSPRWVGLAIPLGAIEFDFGARLSSRSAVFSILVCIWSFCFGNPLRCGSVCSAFLLGIYAKALRLPFVGTGFAFLLGVCGVALDSHMVRQSTIRLDALARQQHILGIKHLALGIDAQTFRKSTVATRRCAREPVFGFW